MSKSAAKTQGLEKSLSEITKLIEKMEHGELTLEQSLAEFEKGITLIKQCQKILTDAEQKVNLLMEKNGEAHLTPYHQDDEDA
jgi:exodeoxyribonuclease VII small subunit